MTGAKLKSIQLRFRATVKFSDVFAVIASEVTLIQLRSFPIEFSSLSNTSNFILLTTLPIFWIFFLSTGKSWELDLGTRAVDFFISPLQAAAKTTIAVSALAYIIKVPISRILIFATLLVAIISLLILRLILAKYFQVTVLLKQNPKFLLWGQMHHFEGIEKSSLFYANTQFESLDPKLNSSPSQRSLEKLMQNLEVSQFTGILLRDSEMNNQLLLDRISILQAQAQLEVFFYSSISHYVRRFSNTTDTKLVKLSQPHFLGRHVVVKRGFDFIFALLAMIIVAPVLALSALAIKATSPGPVLYIDQRVGRNGKPFAFPKLRTMYVGSDQSRAEVISAPDASIVDRYKKDPRITPVGRFLRRWSIDELPQFVCVLAGTMSVVGPRPVISEELVHLDNRFDTRFLAQPGLTGLWQVSGRKETMWEERLRQDVIYVENWAFERDIALIARTAFVIVSGKGAF